MVLTNQSPMFQCCLLLSMLPQEIVGKNLEPERMYDSVNFILQLQVSIVKFVVAHFSISQDLFGNQWSVVLIFVYITRPWSAKIMHIFSVICFNIFPLLKFPHI